MTDNTKAPEATPPTAPQTEAKVEQQADWVSRQDFDTLASQLKALQEQLKPAPKAAPKENSETPTVQSLNAKIKELQEANQREVQNKQDLELRTATRDLLAQNNVPASHQKAAMALLHSENLVGFNEQGELVFRGKYGEVELSKGLAEWAKSDDGKLFQAPRGVQGSGDRKPQRAPFSPKEVSKDELGGAIYRLITG